VATIAARATMDLRARPPGDAPPEIATTTAQAPSRRRSLITAGVGVAVGVIGLATAAIVALPSSSDEVDEAPTEPTEPEQEVVEEPGPTPTLIPPPPIDPNRPDGPVPKSVWRYHSKDTNVLVGLAWGKLVKSAFYTEMRSTLQIPTLSATAAIVALECGFDPLDALEWFTVAIPENSFTQFEMAAGGGWERKPMERCLNSLIAFSGEPVQFEREGAHTRFKFRDEVSLIGWPRDNLLLWTNRGDANRGWMDQRVAGLESARANPQLASLRKQIDSDATFWIVAADASWLDLSSIGADVPRPKSIYASVKMAEDMTLDVGWRYDSAVQAAAASKALQASLDELRKDAFVSFVINEAEVTSRGKDAIIHIYTGDNATRLIGKAVGTTVTDSMKDFGK